MNAVKRVLDVLGSVAKTALLGFALVLALSLVALAIPRKGNYSASIVKVLSREGTGGGTGWIAKSGGQNVIVTNHHVCAVAQGGYARIEDDNGAPYLKRIIRQSFERDLCVLEGIDGKALKLAKSGPKRFDTLQVYGHPGLRPTAPASGVYTGPGIVGIGFSPNEAGICPPSSQQVRSFFGSFCVLEMELGYTTVPILPGNSGSPVTNTDGEVIGVMNSADSTGNQGMFIPLNYVREILSQ